jgi:hypothetical protein
MMTVNDEERSERVDREISRYLNRLAMVLAQSGIPRMPARVFAYVLTHDAEQYTAAELAGGLGVSQAAISGAVRHLVQVGLLTREREPGSRSDQYRVFNDDVWGTIISHQLPLVQAIGDVAEEGVRVLRPGSAAVMRALETREFCAFLYEEQVRLIERWREYRRGLIAGQG